MNLKQKCINKSWASPYTLLQNPHGQCNSSCESFVWQSSTHLGRIPVHYFQLLIIHDLHFYQSCIINCCEAKEHRQERNVSTEVHWNRGWQSLWSTVLLVMTKIFDDEWSLIENIFICLTEIKKNICARGVGKFIPIIIFLKSKSWYSLWQDDRILMQETVTKN